MSGHNIAIKMISIVAKQLSMHEIKTIIDQKSGEWDRLNSALTSIDEAFVSAVYNGSTPIGYIFLITDKDIDDEDIEIRFYWDVKFIFVEPKYRRQGIASLLINPTAEWMADLIESVIQEAIQKKLPISQHTKAEFLSKGGASTYNKLVSETNNKLQARNISPETFTLGPSAGVIRL